MVINTPVRQLRAPHRRLRNPFGRSGDEHPLRDDGAGRIGGRAGHRGRHPRRHRRDVAAGAAQRAGAAERWAGSAPGWPTPMARRGPLCLGIDPHPELLRAWGLPADADGLARFCDICVAAFAGFAVVKPQVAFFESLRRRRDTRCWSARSPRCATSGVLVLADAKRGDIGSTMAAYADAWAGDSPLAADAVTASPYLGFGSLQPLLDTARGARPRGVRAGRDVQPRGAPACSARTPRAGRWPSRSSTQAAAVERATGRPGSVGVVVGATLSDAARCQRARRAGAGARGRRPGRAARCAGGPGRSRSGPAAARGVARSAAGRTGRRRATRRRPSGCGTPSPTSPGDRPDRPADVQVRSGEIHRRRLFGELLRAVCRRDEPAGVRVSARNPHDVGVAGRPAATRPRLGDQRKFLRSTGRGGSNPACDDPGELRLSPQLREYP